jgi:hypothetical protein
LLYLAICNHLGISFSYHFSNPLQQMSSQDFQKDDYWHPAAAEISHQVCKKLTF